MYEAQNLIAHKSERLDSLGVGLLLYHLLEGVGHYHVVGGALHQVWRERGRGCIDAIAIDHLRYGGQLPDVVAVGIDEERVLAIGQILAERQSTVGDDVPSEQLRPRCRAENTFQRLAALAGRGLQDDFCRYVAKLLYTGHDVVRLIVGYCEHSLKGTWCKEVVGIDKGDPLTPCLGHAEIACGTDATVRLVNDMETMETTVAGSIFVADG